METMTALRDIATKHGEVLHQQDDNIVIRIDGERESYIYYRHEGVDNIDYADNYRDDETAYAIISADPYEGRCLTELGLEAITLGDLISDEPDEYRLIAVSEEYGPTTSYRLEMDDIYANLDDAKTAAEEMQGNYCGHNQSSPTYYAPVAVSLIDGVRFPF